MSNILKFKKKDVEIIGKTRLFKGFFEMTKFTFIHRLFEGGWSDPVHREVFERGHAVAILLYDPNLQEFVLLEQFRIGAMETSESPWLIEIVAGIIDEGEEIEDVCHREALEEAGVEITHLTKALSYLASPGGTTERLHIFIGKVDATTASGVHGLEYESEDILVHRIGEKQAMDWIEQGIIDNAAALIALQWFVINKQKVLDEWNGAE